MSCALIDAKRADVSVAMACSVLGVSVSGFYARKKLRASPRQRRDMILLANIRAEFVTSNETYGSPRMHAERKENSLAIARHSVARLMRENGLKARQKTCFKKTTDSDHDGPVAPMFSVRASLLKVQIKNGASIFHTSGRQKCGFT
jgi:putative transposase